MPVRGIPFKERRYVLHQLLVIEGLEGERQSSMDDYLTLQDGFECSAWSGTLDLPSNCLVQA